MGRLAKSFESDLERAVEIVLALPDDNEKMELLQVRNLTNV